jgi:hypothetical protein
VSGLFVGYCTYLPPPFLSPTLHLTSLFSSCRMMMTNFQFSPCSSCIKNVTGVGTLLAAVYNEADFYNPLRAEKSTLHHQRILVNSGDSKKSLSTMRNGKGHNLTVDTSNIEANQNCGDEDRTDTPGTSPDSTYSGDNDDNFRMRNAQTPMGVRGHSDLRSPGMKKTPMAMNSPNLSAFGGDDGEDHADDTNEVIPDFITQTDRHGRASTPRSASAVAAARKMHPTGPKPKLHVERGTLVEDSKSEDEDACESLLDSLRMMCCCFLQDSDAIAAGDTKDTHSFTGPVGYSTRGHDAPLLLEEDSALRNGNDPNRVKLLPELHNDDHGKKCLVLDLDETLVHSSFRAVQGADFVIPVQVSLQVATETNANSLPDEILIFSSNVTHLPASRLKT